MKILYITANVPFGKGEPFVLTELLALKKLNVDLLVVPRDRSEKIFHGEAESIIRNTLNIPWFNLRILVSLMTCMFKRPHQFILLLNEVFIKARCLKVGIKNMIILPKALHVAERIKGLKVSHIHAHWASTTSTMAYIVSAVTGIPWSFTAHRWDIQENNLLEQKSKSASFVRVISEKGREELLKIARDPSLAAKVHVIHMGVNIPDEDVVTDNRDAVFSFLCPANFKPVKGHKYLFEACRSLSGRGLVFKCLIAGSGPLERDLQDRVRTMGLDKCVLFLGELPHDRILRLYREKEIQTVVLPSIETEDGEKEGIPVSLMEAMSYGIPVISTDTGGIPELIGDGSGISVKQQNAAAIAEELGRLMEDKDAYAAMGGRGKQKIARDFNTDAIAKKLLSLYDRYGYGEVGQRV